MSSNKDAIYIQLMNNIKEKIINGEYKIGDKIVSERTMSVNYGINRLTVRRALQELEKEECVKAIQGKGTYVVAIPRLEGKVQLGSGENVSLSTTIKKGGMKSSRLVLSFNKIACEGEMKDYFPQSKQLYQLVRLSLVNDNPYAVQEAYFPCELFSEAERFNFADGSLYDFMDMHNHCPVKVISYLKVVKVPQSYCEVLKMKANKSMFFFDYFGFDQEHKIVEYTKSYHKSEFTTVKYVTEL
ncbi:MAG: GntR family transcriptional regulator [Erysipelotrichaceae bacterium]